jgi:predicted lipase
MYFPKQFDPDLSIELGGLIRQAYAQFDAFENEEDWSLSGRCILLGQLHYVWKPEKAIEKGISNFDVTLRRLSRVKTRDVIRIPIGFIARRQKSVFLILRGTQTSKEWVRNLDIDLTPFLLPDMGKVHGGFLHVYETVRDGILSVLATLDAGMNLYVAGHSLGAALATFAALDIEATTKHKVGALYTYGSPRVGDDEFVRVFNARFHQRSFRIANTSDIVTSIPLPVPIAGITGGYFSHVDAPVDMTVQKNDMKENHSMKTYLAELDGYRTNKGFFGSLFQKAPDRPPEPRP